MSIEQKERRDLIIKYIRYYPNATQANIKKNLETKKYYVSQSTIARDLKELSYEKRNGRYTKTKKKLDSEQQSMLRNLIFYGDCRIIDSSNEIFQVIISTKKGMEVAIENLIQKIYQDSIIGTFSGNGCVMILTNKENNAEIIRKKLISYKTASEPI